MKTGPVSSSLFKIAKTSYIEYAASNLGRTDDGFAIRVREVAPQCLYAPGEKESIDIKQRLELKRRNGLFVDYTKGRSVTFADLLARNLREV